MAGRKRCGRRNSNPKIQIENYKLEADQAERNGEYGKVAEFAMER